MTAAIWDGFWPGPRGRAEGGAGAASPLEARRLVLWEHCRNSLGIARLLVREGRPTPLIDTACHVAVEMACRAALTVGGEGTALADVQSVLPLDLKPAEASGSDGRLAAAERAVGWVADYLRSSAPERSWGF